MRYHTHTFECRGPVCDTKDVPSLFSNVQCSRGYTGAHAFMFSCRVGWRFGGMEGGFGYQADHWPAAQMAAALPPGCPDHLSHPWFPHAATNA